MVKWAFLWITDLHFESPDSNFIDDPKEFRGFSDKKMRENLFREFHSLLDFDYRKIVDLEDQSALSFIAVGGDITTHGRAKGFDSFLSETFPKLKKLVARPEAICVVPGNHDVLWGMDPRTKDYFNLKFKDFMKLSTRNISSCLFPKGELPMEKTNEEHDDDWSQDLNFDELKGGPIYRDRERRVVVVHINSAMRCGELNFQMCADLKNADEPKGLVVAGVAAAETLYAKSDFEERLRPYLIRDVAHITQPQLLELSRRIDETKLEIESEKADWQDYLRVAIVHHHLAPFPNQTTEHKGYEATLDAARVLQFLTGHDFDMVLTGHKHQPYQMKYQFDGKELLILGGPTVGGFAGDDSFRGFQLVEVAANHHQKKVQVRDIPYSLGKRQDIGVKLRTMRPEPLILNRLGGSKDETPESRKHGFRYLDVVSTTKINLEGDGERVVECDGLTLSRESTRSSLHTIELPATAGRLEGLHAAGRQPGRNVFVKEGFADTDEVKWATIKLGFEPKLQPNADQAMSYLYQWRAMDAFAQDRTQYVLKYGKPTEQRWMEFTHLICADPTYRLTVIVQFPAEMVLPEEPLVRIMRATPDNGNARDWERDEEEVQRVAEMGALRYYKPLHMVVLRVRHPKIGLSYGIQWSLPEKTQKGPLQTASKVVSNLTDQTDGALRVIYRGLSFTRVALLSDWPGALDATLLIFETAQAEGPGQLRAVAAGASRKNGDSEETVRRLAKDVVLEVGDGIGGRAFKHNQIRIYIRPSTAGGEGAADAERDAGGEGGPLDGESVPSVYRIVSGTVTHAVLIAFPLNKPVQDDEFEEDTMVYQKIRPYGILNLGSADPACPLVRFRQKAAEGELLRFQHQMNRIFWERGSMLASLHGSPRKR